MKLFFQEKWSINYVSAHHREWTSIGPKDMLDVLNDWAYFTLIQYHIIIKYKGYITNIGCTVNNIISGPVFIIKQWDTPPF